MSFLDIGHVHLNLKFFFSRNTSELKYKILDTDALFLGIFLLWHLQVLKGIRSLAFGIFRISSDFILSALQYLRYFQVSSEQGHLRMSIGYSCF